MPKPSPFKWFKTSPEIIRLAVMFYVRFRHMRALQKLASVHASVTNRFYLERSLSNRPLVKANRAAALAEWRQLGAA